MSSSPVNAKDLLGSYPAMLRAAQRAREAARIHGTPLVIMQNGKVVEIPPDKIKDLPQRLLKIAFGEDYGSKKCACGASGASPKRPKATKRDA